ncbi:MAG: YncE family protein [Gemmatimonadaceae bacterium]
MRPVVVAMALVLALAACGRSDRPERPDAHDAPSAQPDRGPDPLILRVARSGGTARVYAYGRDSLIWTGDGRVPPLGRILGFDPEAGLIAFTDDRGVPGRIDLRFGSVSRARKTPLAGATSADGESIYGVEDGTVVRLTPSGDWRFKPPRPARFVFPQQDGSLLVLAANGSEASVVWRMYPPETTLLDSATLPHVGRALRTPAGDRLYVAAGNEVVGLRSRTLEKLDDATFDAPVTAMLATPSGDRIFVLTEGREELAVYDRFAQTVRTIALPGVPTDLRVDPLGRYLLAHADRSDSAWVIAIGTDRLLGAVRTAWRSDLPLVGYDGSVLAVQGNAVVTIDPETSKERGRVAGGATDYWYQFRWSGFRPRAAGLDQPVNFDDIAPVDSVPADSTAVPADTLAPADTARRPAGPPPPPPDAAASVPTGAASPVTRPAR